MTSNAEGSAFAFKGTDFALNAGLALDLLIGEPNRDKLIARMFGVSLRTAKYLRTGKHWTVDRLKMASALLGRDFDILVIVPLRSAIEPEEVHARIDAVENQIEQDIELLRSEVQDGFFQIMRFLAALVAGETGHATIAQDSSSAQQADEPALIAPRIGNET